jgi:glutamate/tyrosine decarboxylase-like PLP-dependent enzyme
MIDRPPRVYDERSMDWRTVSAGAVLDRAHALALRYLETAGARHVGGAATLASLRAALGGPLPDNPQDPVDVLTRLATDADPGIVASAGPRYFGFVTGGAIPLTVAADWLASAWDQNGAMYVMSPAVSIVEDVVAEWLVELLGLPPNSSVGFVTGCHMANFTCLAAARHEVLRRAGWNVEAQGLQRAPRVTVYVGAEVHVSVVGGLRLLGFGADELVRIEGDEHGRMRVDALADAMTTAEGPAIVCAQVGNVNTGASDPIAPIVDIAHARDGWVHVDGAFGLWAAAVPELEAQVAGLGGADSWATDAHKWLNVPYDSGLAIVADPAPHRAAMGMRASYLQRGADEERIGMDWVPESSRRGRVLPIYALLRTLGRTGVRELIHRTCLLARRMAERLSSEPGVSLLNEVVLNQVLIRFDGQDTRNADEMTRDVIARVQADGTCWAGGALWQARQVMRISISNWSTSEQDVDRSADAILRCYREARA